MTITSRIKTNRKERNITQEQPGDLIKINTQESPFTEYWDKKCCERYIWKAPGYKAFEKSKYNTAPPTTNHIWYPHSCMRNPRQSEPWISSVLNLLKKREDKNCILEYHQNPDINTKDESRPVKSRLRFVPSGTVISAIQ